MSFFDEPIPPPELPIESPQPEWVAPPRAILPAASPQRAVLFQTDRSVLLAHQFDVYPNGVSFTFTLMLRDPHEFEDDPAWMMMRPPGRRFSSDGFLRLGVLLSDGTKWTNVGRRHLKEPTERVITIVGGGGGQGRWDQNMWIWPLPPPGDLTLATAWPIHGVEETLVTIDADELLARAAEAEVLWSPSDASP